MAENARKSETEPMKKLWIWLPVLIIAGGIFMSSSIPYDKQNIQPLLRQHVDKDFFIRWFSWVNFMYGKKEISIANLGVPAFLEFFIRKGAHFISYFVLGFLLSCALRVFKLTGWRNALLALFLAVLYASSDELHQAFTASRNGMVLDVWLDGAGAACGIGVCLWIRKRQLLSSERII
ncbi:VanZ family protein [Aneurinibacillus aneurinilyticus]|uniref:VanZ-like protein n=2 Tax=Aneurinibacillus aneurinilyticus TaxID=1391 RepID=U1Y4K6_ANEAE|nr:VanZ family protein [Aneurinibacillus aneurinilyticus]ERI07112.1 VanZ-like protein [Aneurinibacillus aneurinilyticus ATCC 12856]MED0723706.1 VanZ family protein [Aneurinibacillus aneurinilyticus]MED0741058.1 VanZ family protein [Aneurinibacillus aneurinilyticus]